MTELNQAALNQAYIVDAVRTPFARFGGALATVRADDLAALPIAALIERNPGVDWTQVDDVYYGCANQAGEDNRNVGHMAGLLAGLPPEVPGNTINRLCGSSLDAVGMGARAIMGVQDASRSSAGARARITLGSRGGRAAQRYPTVAAAATRARYDAKAPPGVHRRAGLPRVAGAGIEPATSRL